MCSARNCPPNTLPCGHDELRKRILGTRPGREDPFCITLHACFHLYFAHSPATKPPACPLKVVIIAFGNDTDCEASPENVGRNEQPKALETGGKTRTHIFIPGTHHQPSKETWRRGTRLFLQALRARLARPPPVRGIIDRILQRYSAGPYGPARLTDVLPLNRVLTEIWSCITVEVCVYLRPSSGRQRPRKRDICSARWKASSSGLTTLGIRVRRAHT